MLYGICSWTLGIKDVDKLMQLTSDLGFNGIQYCGHMEDNRAQRVLELAEKHSVELIAYDPFDCRPGDRNGVANFDNATAFYKQAIDYAAELGCAQTLQGISTWIPANTAGKDAWHFLIEALKVLRVYAEERDKPVPLIYELCNRYEVPLMHNSDDYLTLMEEPSLSQITPLFDSFHMNIEEHDPVSTTFNFAAQSPIFHVSGSNREGIAQGHIDFQAHHAALSNGGFCGDIVFEMLLSTNPVNTPPRNDEELSALCDMLSSSLATWKQYQH